MTARLSSSVSWALLKNCASFVVPVGPPSALAPLSEMTITIVLSRTPCSRRKSSSRPRWWSVWLEEAREHLHHPGRQPARLGRQRLPRGHVRVVARQLGVGGQDAELLLAGEHLLAVGVPAVVELAGVPVGPLLRHVVRRVGRPEAQMQVERLVGVDLAEVGDELDRLVDQVLREVVALLGRPRRLDRVVVVDEVGVPLARVPAEEAVEALEAAPERPAVVRAGRRLLVARGQVPLADHVGAVAVLDAASPRACRSRTA